MIKLIASDMDGTLLDENGIIPSEFFSTIKKLNKRNIKFVVASGRPYVTLKENFKPISDSLYYICDNGAYVVENNNLLNVSIINKEIVNAVIKSLENVENVALILCGINGTYHLPLNNLQKEEINKYYIKKTEINNLYNINDDIYKIAICDLNISKNNSYKILAPLFNKDVTVVVSGKYWVDITNLNVNKGKALKEIQKNYNIKYNETMVFGDFYNDIPMLKEAYYSYVMKNANEDMKKYGNFIAPTNKDHGVIKVINEVIINNKLV